MPPIVSVNVNINNSTLNMKEFIDNAKRQNHKYDYEFMGYLPEQFEQIEGKRNISGDIITIREKEVLQLLSDGDSSKIIADKLHISETTAITHRKNLIQKLKVKNTAHLIKIAVQSKIIF